MINKLQERYTALVNRNTSRLLTSVCSDNNSIFFGCFDRNWWHYKIRDFPSIILQQGAYSLSLLNKSEEKTKKISQAKLEDIVQGAVEFWAKRAKLRGFAEEYYPYEDGYPPLAFSTLAIAKIVFDNPKLTFSRDVEKAFLVSAKKLLLRFEANAANQQVAGLSALFYIDRLYPGSINSEQLKSITFRTLSLQHEEGWFLEYDGADLGYLSVTLDCLFDIYDCSQIPQVKTAINNGIGFVSSVLNMCEGNLSGINSRNTDYILPYAFVREYYEGEGSTVKQCELILQRLADRDTFDSVDERYWLHYIGPSITRALNFMNSNKFDINTDKLTLNSATNMPGAGLIHLGNLGNFKVAISAFKGGSLCLSEPSGREFYDYGWNVEINNKKLTSYWYTKEFDFTKTESGIKITGFLYQKTEHFSSPEKHMLLRILSYFLGNKIITALKKIMIFKNGFRGARFTRNVALQKTYLSIHDVINLKNKKAYFTSLCSRATRFSARHVASGNTFSDVGSINDWESGIHTKFTRTPTSLEITTKIKLIERVLP